MPWGWLGLLAFVELVSLFVRINFQRLPDLFASIVLASMAAVAVIGWSHAHVREPSPVSLQGPPYKPWPFVLAQLTAFVVCLWLSSHMPKGDTRFQHLWGLWLFALASTGLAAGVFWLLVAMPARAWIRLALRGWSALLAALALGIGAWALGSLTIRTWEWLRRPTFFLVQWLLQACGENVVSQPADFVLGTEFFSVRIDTPCSGYQGIGLLMVFMGTYLWFFRHRLRFPQAYLLFPCAIPIAWLVNAVRIVLLVMFGTYISSEVAGRGFHSQAGWIGFIAVALGMMAVTQQMPFFVAREPGFAEKSREDDATTTYLAPLFASLALSMITGALFSGFDWLYPVRVLGTAVVIYLFWKRFITWRNLARSFSWGAVAVGVAVFAVWMVLERITGTPETARTLQRSFKTCTLVWRALGSSSACSVPW